MIHVVIYFLVGRLFVNKSIPRSFNELEETIQFVNEGGWWKPNKCKTGQEVAIIVPYRDGKDDLLVLLRHLNPILRRQQINYRWFLIEQVDKYPFNKAKLMNIGYVLSKKYKTYTCFIFHDANFLATNDHNLYDCPTSPRHMSPFNYVLPYNLFVVE